MANKNNCCCNSKLYTCVIYTFTRRITGECLLLEVEIKKELAD
jgi:hypothetical protein